MPEEEKISNAVLAQQIKGVAETLSQKIGTVSDNLDRFITTSGTRFANIESDLRNREPNLTKLTSVIVAVLVAFGALLLFVFDDRVDTHLSPLAATVSDINGRLNYFGGDVSRMIDAKAQQDGRVDVLEKDLTAMHASLTEFESRLHEERAVTNVQFSGQQRVNAMLWPKVFQEQYPQIQYYPETEPPVDRSNGR